MKPGVYKFFVNQYSGSARNGFRAEIEFNGEIYSFDYSNSMRTGQDVYVADVILDTNGEFTIKEKISGTLKSQVEQFGEFQQMSLRRYR